jgi:hypothetical protein
MPDSKGLIKFSNPVEEDIHYNCGEFMQSLIAFGIRLLEGLFVVGVAGSALVLVTGLIENLVSVLGRSSDAER